MGVDAVIAAIIPKSYHSNQISEHCAKKTQICEGEKPRRKGEKPRRKGEKKHVLFLGDPECIVYHPNVFCLVI